MYQISRSIYRELEAEIIEGRGWGSGPTNHQRVLRACEAAVERLTTDRHYFARPVADAVQRHPGLLPDVRPGARVPGRRPLHDLRRPLPGHAAERRDGADGRRQDCRATTRKGTPCQRVPLPSNGYCPSHQHLAETEEVLVAA